MDTNPVQLNGTTLGVTSVNEQMEALKATIATLQQANAKFEQQVKDNAVELQATIDEFLRAKEETEHAKEETERAKEQAERANTVKSAFLASMSHELRTPLNAILNFSQFLSSEMLGPVNEEQIDMLDKITTSGQHLLNLINDILDISKIEAGSLHLFVEDKIDLANEVEVVADMGRALLKDKPVEFHVEITPDIPHIIADRRRIRQILLNLVSNACKFTEKGTVTLSLCRQEDRLQITVKDTGPGIAPEDYEAIFEAFRQSKTGLLHGAGTGLGLAISQRLAEAHEGQLWMESAVGVGSAFYVTLPLHSPVLLQLLKEAENES